MEEAPNNMETLKYQITQWFEDKKRKLEEAFPNMSEGDLKDVLATLRRIDSEYDEFNDFIPKST